MQQSRFIQGDLQTVFDVLYLIGTVDPMLKTNWNAIRNQEKEFSSKLSLAIEAVNQCSGDRTLLLSRLQALDAKTLQILTMEVGRELAEFADRQSIH